MRTTRTGPADAPSCQELQGRQLERTRVHPSEQSNECRDRRRRPAVKRLESAQPYHPSRRQRSAASRDARLDRPENVGVQPVDHCGGGPLRASARKSERASVMVKGDQRPIEPPDESGLGAADAELPVGVIALAKLLREDAHV